MLDEGVTNMDDEISLKELINKFNQVIYYLRKQWWKIFIVASLGGLMGFFYAYSKPITYSATLSFVVEEGKSSSAGLAAIAGQFGLDVGGANGTGLLNGENLLLFLKSNELVKQTLLTNYDSTTRYSLADKYADVYGLREKWLKSSKVGKAVYFPISEGRVVFTRLQDSLLMTITSQLIKKELVIERPEKKATFITVQTTMRDELLSKFFCERLVQKATEIYVQSKIKRQKNNVDRLQKRSDSIGAILNNKTFVSASDQEKILDINPASRTSTVNAEISGREKMMLATIYGEVVKNLEISKLQLSQETPSIQIIDPVGLPLNKNKIGFLTSSIIGFIIFSAFYIFFLVIKKYLQSV
jgi:hypothetical protein